MYLILGTFGYGIVLMVLQRSCFLAPVIELTVLGIGLVFLSTVEFGHMAVRRKCEEVSVRTYSI